ncbi:hypothetical protein Nepgr_018958 [Nepenthes gracilis]|uniref:Dof zinc finger protein n=1 Tax=Nepenthes gracilis TaxID=150966 RepID=A0AAD3SV09_NEPGR|nr:hypothetical protein Nepgr_018958 [Nepenthes gracilis]
MLKGSGGGGDQELQWPINLVAMDGRWKANIEAAPNCPRCASINTKFCYYNNYSLSQPRYFCKGCRRYWTKGGSLRDVPVGGRCRKSHRAKSAKKRTSSYSSHPHSLSSASGDHEENSPSTDSNGVDIDLAEVFANFLNYNSVPNDTTAAAAEDVDSVGSWKPAGDLDQDSRWRSMAELPDQMTMDEGKLQQEERMQGIAIDPRHHVGSSSLGEDVEDVFWSDDSTFSCWQPISELQEFDDQFKNLTNQMMLNDNYWSCFDQQPQKIV